VAGAAEAKSDIAFARVDESRASGVPRVGVAV
jgi:hypothetical protein